MSNYQDFEQENDFSENIEENNIFSVLGLQNDPEKQKERFNKNDKLVKSTKKKILKILSKIDVNLLKISDSLIENISFMSVTLDDLIQTIKAKGIKEFYCNGKNQFGFKESVEIKIYNTMQKNFQSSMKLLIDMLSRNGLNDDETEELKKLLARPR
jgi:hypothetical protein